MNYLAMISVIICSKHKILPEKLSENIKYTIGTEYELIHIDNSEDTFSIFSAYNEGARRSKYPYLCYVHDDVCFHSPNWGLKIISHLQTPNVGICGLAGRDFITKVPASWKQDLPSVNIIQSDRIGIRRTRRKYRPANFKLSKRSVIILDGVILCMKRELMDKLSFDEDFEGFHGYDFDICIQSVVGGYDNYVMYDILLEHYSRGTPDAIYYKKLIQVFKKWSNQLPILGIHSSQKVRYSIPSLDRAGLSRLLRKLVRRGLDVAEIKQEISYFTNVADISFKGLRKNTIRIEIYLMRILNFPIYWANRMKLKSTKQ